MCARKGSYNQLPPTTNLRGWQRDPLCCCSCCVVSPSSFLVVSARLSTITDWLFGSLVSGDAWILWLLGKKKKTRNRREKLAAPSCHHHRCLVRYCDDRDFVRVSFDSLDGRVYIRRCWSWPASSFIYVQRKRNRVCNTRHSTPSSYPSDSLWYYQRKREKKRKSGNNKDWRFSALMRLLGVI